MKILQKIVIDIQRRQNIDIYITISIAVLVSILGLVQVADQSVISSAVLATLALVSFSLLMNRKENEEIRKALTVTDNLQERFEEITSRLNVSFTFVRRESRTATQKIRKLVQEASMEMLVLDYNPLEDTQDKVRYPGDVKLSESRKGYYTEIIEKVRNSQPGTFRYKRILQVPIGRQIADILVDDPIFKEHCEALIQLGGKQPEIVSLKSCVPLYEANYIIIDKRHLILEINILDPDNRYYSSGGFFFFDDPSGSLISTFLRYFERVNEHAKLVNMGDLNK